ncbi:MAG: hypothetical protein H0Z19_01985 [Archaeoglobus sp.]|uniref:DUF7287 family protein n=1 Tax=Archaeoglobus sp. TaxID=1872626 RepID=UPI001DBBACAE|nr:hypothetical protein [Archaeoglobus sp.]MBO8179243.1 hypothetical protein [Archaeoglobus sp.]
MSKYGRKSTEGKLSLDMLIGLSMFLVTFIFVAQFLPGVFADVRYEISLGSQAYRIATLLVEDSGYPADWDSKVYPSNCDSYEFRIGLANFDYTKGTEENHLNTSKILKVDELMGYPICREKIEDYLGLNVGNQSYHFNFSLKQLNGSVLVSGGGEVPEMGQVMKFERLVYVDNCTAIPCDTVAGRCVCRLEVVVWT